MIFYIHIYIYRSQPEKGHNYCLIEAERQKQVEFLDQIKILVVRLCILENLNRVLCPPGAC